MDIFSLLQTSVLESIPLGRHHKWAMAEMNWIFYIHSVQIDSTTYSSTN